MASITEQGIHLFGVIFSPCGHHVEEADRLSLFQIFLWDCCFIQSSHRLAPIWPQLFHDAVEPVGNLPVVTGYHGFEDPTGGIRTALFIIIDDVSSHAPQPFFITQNNLHAAHGSFALVHILLCRPISFTLTVIFLDLLGLIFIHEDTWQTRIIDNRYGNAVILGLLHGVCINDFTKYMYGIVDRSSRESHIGCFW